MKGLLCSLTSSLRDRIIQGGSSLKKLIAGNDLPAIDNFNSQADCSILFGDNGINIEAAEAAGICTNLDAEEAEISQDVSIYHARILSLSEADFSN